MQSDCYSESEFNNLFVCSNPAGHYQVNIRQTQPKQALRRGNESKGVLPDYMLPKRFFASSRIDSVAVAPDRVAPAAFIISRSSRVRTPPAHFT
jgi:hypothetical protein